MVNSSGLVVLVLILIFFVATPEGMWGGPGTLQMARDKSWK